MWGKYYRTFTPAVPAKSLKLPTSQYTDRPVSVIGSMLNPGDTQTVNPGL